MTANSRPESTLSQSDAHAANKPDHKTQQWEAISASINAPPISKSAQDQISKDADPNPKPDLSNDVKRRITNPGYDASNDAHVTTTIASEPKDSVTTPANLSRAVKGILHGFAINGDSEHTREILLREGKRK